MPTNQPTSPLPWTEDNISRSISEIYAQAIQDQAFRNELMADSEKVLSQWLEIPDAYKGKFHAKDIGIRMFVLNVPPYEETNQTEASALPPADYTIICTTFPPW